MSILLSSIRGATLSLVNVHPESEIFLNNTYIGEGPIHRYNLEEGTHQIKVYKDNQKTFSKVVSLAEGEDHVIDLFEVRSYRSSKNKQKAKSTISVFTSQEDAEILLNNRPIARGSISDFVVKPGTYQIEIYDGDQKIFSTIADIDRNESKVFNVSGEVDDVPASIPSQSVYTPTQQTDPEDTNSSTLSVFTDDQQSKIFINGSLAGKGNVVDYELPLGSHHITVFDNGIQTYSKTVDIPDSKPVVVDATRFVNYQSDMPNLGAKQQEVKRMKESRGNFGLGLSFGHTSGINLRYYLNNRIGLQGTYFGSSIGDESFNSWNAKAIFVLKDTVMNDRPGSLYFTTGFGERNADSDTEQTNIGSFEANLGLEIPMASWFQSGKRDSVLRSFAKGILSTDNAYFNLEVGYLRALGNSKEYTSYGYLDTVSETDYSGIGARAGLTYFF